MAQEEKSVKNIQSVHRALDLLEAICERGYGYKLGELAVRCGLNKSTAFHLLKTLEARGYVEQSYDTQMYKLGWKSFDLFAEVYEKLDTPSIALPYMRQIHQQVNETVSFYYFLRNQEHYVGSLVAQIESTHPLKYSARMGSRIPLHCTAAGKVRFLGYTPEMLEQQLKATPFPVHTPNTITDPEILRAQLADIRRDGYCMEWEEYLPGICSVAIPLFKYTGRVIYALSVSVPVSRATPERMEEIAREVMTVLQRPSGHPDFIFKGTNL